MTWAASGRAESDREIVISRAIDAPRRLGLRGLHRRRARGPLVGTGWLHCRADDPNAFLSTVTFADR
jgi:hypothetical protein